MSYQIQTENKTRTFEEQQKWNDMQDLLDDQGVEYTALVDGQAPADHDVTQGDSKPSNSGATTPEVVEEEPPQPTEEDIESAPSVEDDPVDWLPDHFIDHIQGVPTVNRKGYAVIASKYDVSVTAEPVVRASETGFEYAEFQATAYTADGTEYSGFGSAHINRDNGDSPYLLNELAETRAMKRAVAWATGIGLTAVEELQGKQ
jgi:hypothetical protein